MKKMESTLVNMVCVLVGVALIMGGILAYVNHMTEGPISLQAEKALSDGIKAVMMSDNLTITANDTVRETIDNKECVFIVHKAADANGKEIGAAVESTTLGFGGDLKVLVGFNPDGDILGYTLLSIPRLLDWEQRPMLGFKKTASRASSAKIPPRLSSSARMVVMLMPLRLLPSLRGLS